MLTTLANPILPVFAILALGYVLNRAGLFDVSVAQAINRFVFYVATPALIFSIIAEAPIERFELRPLGLYFGTQVVVYVGTALFMHRVLGRATGESLLLGMTTTFVNHVFFVLPIAERVYGAATAQLISGIVLVDAAFWFCGTVLVVDLMQAKRPSVKKVVGLLVKNPFLIAAALGVMTWSARPIIPEGVFTYATFAGGAAAPTALFVLGIILASSIG